MVKVFNQWWIALTIIILFKFTINQTISLWAWPFHFDLTIFHHWLNHFNVDLTNLLLIKAFHFGFDHFSFDLTISLLIKPFHFWLSNFNSDKTISLSFLILKQSILTICFQTWWFNTSSTNEFTIDWTVLQFLLLYVVF